MTKIDIISGFLGAGKTTLIKKLLKDALSGEKVVLLENEFGEVGIDGGFMKEAGIEIKEMNSGCICCSLVGDFEEALGELLKQLSPDRIIIEPSGVGKLSDVARAVENAGEANGGVVINSKIVVADAGKCKMYMSNFGEFYNDQIENADAIILSRTGDISEDKLDKCVDMIRTHNAKAPIVTTPWEEISGAKLLEVMEGAAPSLEIELKAEHEHHHHDHDDECCCHDHEHEHEHEHHHHHDDECEHEHEHEHHHHHDDEHEHDHEHDHEHHHHHDDDECCCHDDHHHHDHDHEHHHHHHADDIFQSIGIETHKKFSEADIAAILSKLDDKDTYGLVLRAKGIIDSTEGEWIHFDYVPGDSDIRRGAADYTGRLCVIGTELKETAIKDLFLKG